MGWGGGRVVPVPRPPGGGGCGRGRGGGGGRSGRWSACGSRAPRAPRTAAAFLGGWKGLEVSAPAGSPPEPLLPPPARPWNPYSAAALRAR